MDPIEVVPIKSQSGYYQDADGNWHPDRRSYRERRKRDGTDATGRLYRRTQIRRQADRDALAYVDESAAAS